MKEVLLLFVNPMPPEPAGYEGGFLVLEIIKFYWYNSHMKTFKGILGFILFLLMAFAAWMVSPWMFLGFSLVVVLAILKK